MTMVLITASKDIERIGFGEGGMKLEAGTWKLGDGSTNFFNFVTCG